MARVSRDSDDKLVAVKLASFAYKTVMLPTVTHITHQYHLSNCDGKKRVLCGLIVLASD